MRQTIRMEVQEDATSQRFHSKILNPVVAGQYDLSIVMTVSPSSENHISAKLLTGCFENLIAYWYYIINTCQ
jgi:hypothetical protein